MNLGDLVLPLFGAVLLAACGPPEDRAEDEAAAAPPPPPPRAARVDAVRLLSGAPDQWLAPGRTYGEQRYSPLRQITADNVAELGLAWFADLNTGRTQEATPLFVDGVIYVTTAWSNVRAYDARSGTLVWAYDARVPREWGSRACCDVVNRGAAAWNGNIYVGTIDGRLLALDAESGALMWQIDTLITRDVAYTITGAPRVVKGQVIIGNGGAEFGVRGYVSAYDAATGALSWRFFHRARRSCARLRERDAAHGRANVER